MGASKSTTPPNDDQLSRVLNLFKRVTDPYQRGKVIGKLEAYVEQAEKAVDASAEKSA